MTLFAGCRRSLETLFQDLRFGVRTLLRSPGFTSVALVTLALGIGANTAIFSVVQGVLLTPLPLHDPDRLVLVWQSRPGVPQIDISYPDFQDLQRTGRSFDHMAAFSERNFNLTGPGTAEHLIGMDVTSGFFATLSIRPTLGRDFAPTDDREGAAPVAILSDRLWRDRFASSPKAIGKSIAIEGENYTVIGVLPPRFHLWSQEDVYLSLARSAPRILLERSVHGIAAIGRLKPGLSIGQALSEMNAVQQNLDQIYPQSDRNIGIDLTSLRQDWIGDVRGTLLLLLGAVGLVLLIACANIANLLLARSASRTREFAVRAALGAGRARVVRQLLTESMLLALAGGALGLLVAVLAIRVILASLPDSFPRAENIGVHLPVLLFTFAVAIAVGVVFGLGPALKSAKVDLQSGLKEGARGSTGFRHRVQSQLVVGQVALTLVLLVAAGLLFRTIRNLLQVDPGFDAREIIKFNFALSPSLTRTAATTRTALGQLLDRIRHVPGVQSAELTSMVPLSGGDNSGPFWLGTAEPASPQDAPHALYFWTGPDYLDVMKIPLLAGRFFTSADTIDSQKVIVIDSVLAQTYFPHANPIGQVITVAHWGAARVVGVVGHVRHWGLDDPGTYNPRQIYIPIYQLPDAMVHDFFRNELIILVRTPLPAASVLPAIRSTVYGAAGDQPIFGVKTIDQVITDSMASQRLPMMLLGAFAALALVLASVGIYGVISYSVAQRVREIGVRMALGAGRLQILRLITVQGLRMAVWGLAIGAVAALLLTRLLTSFSHLLYGVPANDPGTFAATAVLLMVLAVAACAIPALRAARVDPIKALRCE
jgi:predicted permease